MSTDRQQDESKKISSHFLNLFSLAIADSDVSPKEIELLYDLGIEGGVSKAEVDFLIDNPHKVKFVAPNSIHEKSEQLFDFCRMILADGRIDVREILTFKTLSKLLKIEDNQAQDILTIYIDGIKEGKQKSELISNVNRILSGT